MPGPKMDDMDWEFDVGNSEDPCVAENRGEIERLVKAAKKHESLLQGLMNQEDPVSRWGKDVEARLEELEGVLPLEEFRGEHESVTVHRWLLDLQDHVNDLRRAVVGSPEAEAVEEFIGKDVNLRSLTEWMARVDDVVTDVLEQPEQRGMATGVDVGPMPVAELLQGADRHIEEAETQLEIALQMSDSGKHPTKDTRDRLKAAQVHAETAKAQVSLARAVSS